jgi:hypothetical protein
MPLSLNDHDKFHAAVARSVLAAGAAGLVGMFLPAPGAAALLTLAAGLAVVVPASFRSAAIAAVLACIAGGAMKLPGAWLGPLVTALAVGLAVGRDLDAAKEGGWVRRLGVVGLGALGAGGALLVGRAIQATAALPSGIEALAGGAAGGLMIGVASLGRHIGFAKPALDAELRTLAAANSDNEIGELLLRAANAWREAKAALGGQADEVQQAADDLVVKIVGFARRFCEVEAEARRTRPDELRERLNQLEARLAATTDAMARAEFARARDAVAAQLGSLGEIDKGRERAVARLTHQVAILERLRLAAIRHRSVDATRLGAELAPVVDELADAGSDLDLASDALTEATAATTVPEPTTAGAPTASVAAPAEPLALPPASKPVVIEVDAVRTEEALVDRKPSN